MTNLEPSSFRQSSPDPSQNVSSITLYELLDYCDRQLHSPEYHNERQALLTPQNDSNNLAQYDLSSMKCNYLSLNTIESSPYIKYDIYLLLMETFQQYQQYIDENNKGTDEFTSFYPNNTTKHIGDSTFESLHSLHLALDYSINCRMTVTKNHLNAVTASKQVMLSHMSSIYVEFLAHIEHREYYSILHNIHDDGGDHHSLLLFLLHLCGLKCYDIEKKQWFTYQIAYPYFCMSNFLSNQSTLASMMSTNGKHTDISNNKNHCGGTVPIESILHQNGTLGHVMHSLHAPLDLLRPPTTPISLNLYILSFFRSLAPNNPNNDKNLVDFGYYLNMEEFIYTLLLTTSLHKCTPRINEWYADFIGIMPFVSQLIHNLTTLLDYQSHDLTNTMVEVLKLISYYSSSSNRDHTFNDGAHHSNDLNDLIKMKLFFHLFCQKSLPANRQNTIFSQFYYTILSFFHAICSNIPFSQESDQKNLKSHNINVLFNELLNDTTHNLFSLNSLHSFLFNPILSSLASSEQSYTSILPKLRDILLSLRFISFQKEHENDRNIQFYLNCSIFPEKNNQKKKNVVKIITYIKVHHLWSLLLSKFPGELKNDFFSSCHMPIHAPNDTLNPIIMYQFSNWYSLECAEKDPSNMRQNSWLPSLWW